MNLGKVIFRSSTYYLGNSFCRNFNKRTQKFDYKKLVKVNKKANKKPRLNLILKEDVPNLGFAGQLVQVKRGYGRNDLILNRRAVYATDENKAKYLKVREEKGVKNEVEDPKILPFFEKTLLKITQRQWRSLEDTAKDISTQCRKKLGVVVPVDCVEMQEAITTSGDHVVGIIINENVSTTLKCSVVLNQ
ncbi:LOW QUALITY PROTEIN: 50S ribosomal protein L9-like [Xenia sp. Carnegie-2017]|uniref:LOW QUALITY PROTEIN: 50S ribosomal protein L9-like n=1 Tax=Xenia sp. Carnegie-2017 TaxID=2897299 RepID=UPI001F038B16|nr:LOW QUALITY PROTEIN: 50S ribosomal protein L9-like [Xenia sp. Carnegie-2017]